MNITEEARRRVAALPRLDHTFGAPFTFGKHAMRAVQKHGPAGVDWGDVHKRTILEAIGQHGQESDDVLDAIVQHSPGAIDPAVEKGLRGILDRMAPELSRRYDAARTLEDAAAAAAKAGGIKFVK